MPAPYTAAQIIALTNAARQSHQLPPLHPDPLLTQAAQHKAAAMLAAHSWSHNTPTQTPWEFLDAVGYRYQTAGENLARNFTNSQDVVQAWLDSPAHRSNLLNPEYTQIGVAVATGSADSATSILVVQYLASPMTQTTTLDNQFHATDIIDFTSTGSSPVTYFVLVLVSALVLASLARLWRHQSKRRTTTTPHPKYWRH